MRKIYIIFPYISIIILIQQHKMLQFSILSVFLSFYLDFKSAYPYLLCNFKTCLMKTFCITLNKEKNQ